MASGKKKGPIQPKKPVDPIGLYRHALQFWHACDALEEVTRERLFVGQQARALALAVPTAALAAFTIELLLKLLHVLNGQPVPVSHSISGLFLALPAAEQAAIKSAVEPQFAKDPGAAFLREQANRRLDLDYVLRGLNEAFVRLRYAHEGLEPDSGLSTLGNAIFGQVLFERAWHHRPEFRNLSAAAVEKVSFPVESTQPKGERGR